MQCPVCGRFNSPSARACSLCRTPLGTSTSRTQGKGRLGARFPWFNQTPLAWSFTLALALALAFVGVAGVRAEALFQHALRTPTASDIAAQVCTAYTTQNYDLLLRNVDPAPIPPAAPGPFSPATLRDELRTIDSREGKAVNCTYKALVAPTGTTTRGTSLAQVAVSVRRAHASQPDGILLTLHLKSGHWLISRESTLTASAAG